jgi:hypothetical protein
MRTQAETLRRFATRLVVGQLSVRVCIGSIAMTPQFGVLIRSELLEFEAPSQVQ